MIAETPTQSDLLRTAQLSGRIYIAALELRSNLRILRNAALKFYEFHCKPVLLHNWYRVSVFILEVREGALHRTECLGS